MSVCVSACPVAPADGTGVAKFYFYGKTIRPSMDLSYSRAILAQPLCQKR